MLLVIVVLSSLLFSANVIPVRAGPLNSFAQNPIPYWDDDSLGIGISWDANDQTIEINDDGLKDYDRDTSTCWAESFAVVTDWTASVGNALTTDGDIGSLEVPGDGNYDVNWADANIPGDAGHYTITVRHKENETNGADVRVYVKAGNGGGGANTKIFVLTPTLIWLTETALIGGVTNIESVVLYVKADDNIECLVDYIHIGLPELELKVPIKRQDLQIVEMYVNTTDLDSEVQLELYDNVTASGTYCSFNSTHVNFIGAGYVNDEAYAVYDDGLVRIRFEMNNMHHLTTITVAGEDRYFINSWTDESSISSNNWLRFNDSVFDGSFTLYYLDGDTDYSVLINTKPWEKTIDSPDEDIDQGIYTLEVTDVTDTVITHNIRYEKEVNYFQWFRSEQVLGYIPVQGGGEYAQDTEFTFEFVVYYPNGTENCKVTFWIDIEGDTVGGSVDINSDVNIEWDGVLVGPLVDQDDDSLTENAISRTQIMIWRDYSNHIGVGFTSNSFIYQLEDKTDARELEAFTIWTSPDPVTDWGNSSFLIDYEYYSEIAGNAQQWMYFAFDAFEFQEWINEGFAQPHFSSTAHDGGARDRYTSTNAYIWANWDFWDVYYGINPDEPDSSPAPEEWYEQLIRMFGDFGDAVAMGFGMIADAGLENPIVVGLRAVIQNVANFLGSAIQDAPDFGGITAVTDLLGSVFGAIVWVFGIFGGLVGFIGTGIAWIDYYLITPQGFMLVCGVLVLPIVVSLSGSSVMGKPAGFEGAIMWVAIYASWTIMILGFLWSVISTTLGLIGNFIPFT